MKAVNEKHVWRYITKPWQREDLKISIQNAIEIYQNRQEKKELLSILKEKNRLLLELNTQLEEKIMERTIQLQDKNKILQMLAEDTSMDLILKEICSAISRQLKTTHIFIDIPFLNKSFSNDSVPITKDLQELSNTTIAGKKEIITEKGLCIPLFKNETVLGTIITSNPHGVNGFRLADQEGSFISIATLCLTQAWNLQEVDRLMDQIK
jgi:hypothetical protein